MHFFSCPELDHFQGSLKLLLSPLELLLAAGVELGWNGSDGHISSPFTRKNDRSNP